VHVPLHLLEALIRDAFVVVDLSDLHVTVARRPIDDVAVKHIPVLVDHARPEPIGVVGRWGIEHVLGDRVERSKSYRSAITASSFVSEPPSWGVADCMYQNVPRQAFRVWGM
jgi:hypothetical protein